jgi:hypothetical protein
VIPPLHHYPVSMEPQEIWKYCSVMLGFDAEERLLRKLPHNFAAKVASRSALSASRPGERVRCNRLAAQCECARQLIPRMIRQNAAHIRH